MPTKEHPLLLMAISTEKAQGSQWTVQEDVATVTVHPQSASDLKNGDLARLESEIGSLTVCVKLDPRQRQDLALMAKGGWVKTGQCANLLVPARPTDAGGGAAYYDTPVRLVRL